MSKFLAAAFAVLLGLVALGACAGSATASESHGHAHFEPTRADKVVKTDDEWKEELSPMEFRILREKGTERAFTGRYWDNKKAGVYHCAGCGLALFDSDTKFRSGTGWPSFYAAIGEDHVATVEDRTLGMTRTEILCNRCGGHLGHVFPDGPPPTGQRYCVNGYALDFTPAAEQPEKTK